MIESSEKCEDTENSGGDVQRNPRIRHENDIFFEPITDCLLLNKEKKSITFFFTFLSYNIIIVKRSDDNEYKILNEPTIKIINFCILKSTTKKNLSWMIL